MCHGKKNNCRGNSQMKSKSKDPSSFSVNETIIFNSSFPLSLRVCVSTSHCRSSAKIYPEPVNFYLFSLFLSKCFPLLCTDVCSSKILMIRPNMIVFGDRTFREVIKVK